MQFIAAYDKVAADPSKRALMGSKSLKGEWCRFTGVAVVEMAAVTAGLVASGVTLIGDGREQAATHLEQRRQELKQTMSTFFRVIADKAAAKNKADLARDASS